MGGSGIPVPNWPLRGPLPPPPVTVIVPARDEAPLIAQSLRSLLAQDYAGSLRVILVDDGSTDGTGAIARSIADPRLTVVEGQPRPSAGAASCGQSRRGSTQPARPISCC